MADRFDEFFAWSRHERRMFWTALLLETAALFGHSYIFGTIIALASGSVGAFLHCACERKEVKVLWFRTDIPDVKTITNAIRHAETNTACFDKATMRHTIYGVTLAALIYAAYLIMRIWP